MRLWIHRKTDQISITRILFLLLSVLVLLYPSVRAQKRTKYKINLAKIAVSLDENTQKLKRVRITYKNSNEEVNITPFTDEYVQLSRNGRKRHIHQETWEKAHQISDFEYEHLNRVINTLTETLDDFEHNVHKKRWDKCLYLDAYLPRFLRGFYYLCEAIKNHHDALPSVVNVPERAYEVSQASSLSNKRINHWKTNKQHQIQLRIATRNFIKQLAKWQTVSARKKNPDYFFDMNLRKSYKLFIRLYFNLQPPPNVSKHSNFDWD